ncbi:uncharacterized protein OCT59_012836 [Rhizophagus irregularis]|uniref:uncharacterized protein n=1 Tax=Rhizophagus irregularis TaxID=588596 RepID=UPI0019EB6FAF|nr:hypothetical protein OCT59_012836 [Rhizophagus irregularis]GET61768.1 hypothetical protein GLOIN_2v1483732 [Rhizophagus irregularis DAOM 181602=DAOM 197198]
MDKNNNNNSNATSESKSSAIQQTPPAPTPTPISTVILSNTPTRIINTSYTKSITKEECMETTEKNEQPKEDWEDFLHLSYVTYWTYQATETERKKKLNKLIKRYDHLPTKMYHSPLSKTQENKSKFTNTKSLSSIDINVQLSSPEVIKKSTSTPSKTIIEASSITEITNWCSQIQEDSRNSGIFIIFVSVYNIYNITIYNLINIRSNKSF